MTIKLIVTESDEGDSLTLPGEWSCESVDYDEEQNSITTYEYSALSKQQTEVIEQALDDASGVVSYTWIKPVGRPPASGSRRQVRISATIPPEYDSWLREHGDISSQIRSMIERGMKGEH